MKKCILFIITTLMFSCGEQLMEKPEDLIPKEKMVEILKDLAIANAAKSTNIAVLKDNKIEPTAYVMKKHNIDSARFVESDTYYASLPAEYEAIYEEVEARLEGEKKRFEEMKKVDDSLKALALKKKSEGKGTKAKKIKDSLP